MRRVIAVACVFVWRFYTNPLDEENGATRGDRPLAGAKRKRGLLRDKKCDTNEYIDIDVRVCALACLFLAAKVVESTIHGQHIVDSFNQMFAPSTAPNSTDTLDSDTPKSDTPESDTFVRMKIELLHEMEVIVLSVLNSELWVDDPYSHLLSLIQSIPMEDDRGDITTKAWSVMNDSYNTKVHITYSSETIAVAVLYVVAVISKSTSIKTYLNDGQYCLLKTFGEHVDQSEVKEVTHIIMGEYEAYIHAPKTGRDAIEFVEEVYSVTK